jgi:hypothetical protein
MFSDTLGVSTTTGYDWGQVSSEAKSEVITVTVEAKAPPGLILQIEQAVGHCGGNDVQTELFKINTIDPGTQQVLHTEYVHEKMDWNCEEGRKSVLNAHITKKYARDMISGSAKPLVSTKRN